MLFPVGKNPRLRTSLAVQRLGLHGPTAEAMGSIPGRGTNIPHAAQRGQKKRKKIQGFNWATLLVTNCAFKKLGEGFPGGAVVENLPANAGDTGSSPGLGRSHMPRSN